jgi:predicted nucleic-acid-binding protein
MIGLDANILIRYFAQDDPRQSAIATDVIERRLTEDEPGFVSTVALAETIWVLERSLKLDTNELILTLRLLLGSSNLVIESHREVAFALSIVEEGLGTFADALIGALGASAGCSRTLTFDRGALRLPDFALP